MGVDAGTIYSEIRVALDKLKADIGQVESQFNKLGNNLGDSANKAQKKWTDSFKNINLQGLIAVAALTMAVKGAITTFASFEQSMANTQSVARGTAEEYKALEQAALEAGETTRFSAKQAADALYYLASAGLKGKDIIDALNGTLQLAGATQSDLAFTSAAMTATLSQFNLAASESIRVSNVFAAGIQYSQATMDKLATSMRYVGPVANAFNMSIEETVGVLQILYNAGLEGSMAGTALRGALADLGNATGPVIEKLKKYGITFEQINPETHKFSEVIDTLKKAGVEGGDAIAIFGDRAGPAMIKLISAGRAEIERYTVAVTDTNAAAESYAIQNDTLQGSLDMLKNAVEGAEISLMKEFAPAIRGVVDFITELIKGFDSLPGPVKIFIGIVAMGIPIIAGLTFVITSLAAALGTVLGPITLIISGIAALTAGYVAITGAIEEAKIAHQKQADAIGAEIEDTRKLAIRYNELQGKVKLNAKEKAEAAKIEKILKERLGETSLIIDEQTGKLKLNKEAFTKYYNEKSKLILEELKQQREVDRERVASLRKRIDEDEKALSREAAMGKAGEARRNEILRYLDKYEKELRQAKLQLIETQEKIDALSNSTGNYNEDLKEENQLIKEETELIDGNTEAKQKMIEANQKMAETEQEYKEKLEDLMATSEESIEIERQRAVEAVKNSDASITAKKKAVATINEYYAALKDKTAEDQFADNMQTVMESLENFGWQVGDTLSELYTATADRRIAELDRQMQAELEAAGVAEETTIARLQRELDEARAAGDQELIQEKEKELKREQIILEFERKKAKIKYDAEMATWRITLIQAFAEAARAIIVSATSLPWPWSLIPMAATIALTGIQIAAIRKSQPVKPKFQTGGIVLPSGSNGREVNVAEGDSTELLLNNSPRGLALLRQFAKAIATEMGGTSGSFTIFLNIDGKKLAENSALYYNGGVVRLEI